MATAGHSSFSFLQQIPGLEHVPNHILTAGFVGITLILTSWVARLQLKTAMQRPDGGIVPDRTLTYRNFFEIGEVLPITFHRVPIFPEFHRTCPDRVRN